MNSTLKQSFEKWNLYSGEIEKLEKEGNPEIEKILNSKYLDLYELYVNSDEFKINETNRLKKQNMNEWYINTYQKLSNDLIKLC